MISVRKFTTKSRNNNTLKTDFFSNRTLYVHIPQQSEFLHIVQIGPGAVVHPAFEQAFRQHMQWSPLKGAPYVVDNNAELLRRVGGDDMVHGVTISAGGFYGPQGRELRIPIADPEQNAKVMAFEHDGLRITNFEMESSALAGLAALLGHRAMTCCMVVANRVAKEAMTGYKGSIDGLITKVLDRI